MRPAAAGLVAGPVALTSTWAVLGRRAPGYSPVREPVSRLAGVGAGTRRAMSAGFLAYALAVGAGSAALVRRPGTGASGDAGLVSPGAALATAVGTLGLAAFPLDWSRGDGAHVAVAAATYAALAAAPLTAAPGLRRLRRNGASRAAVAAGVATAAAFVASRTVPERQGLFQRIGLCISHGWIAGAGVAALRA
ncbi:MAG TPA: DUF998 domain-containing protein [Acidimicrobiales bacterium]|nr:DUF998 domain-containing protein [Acidimicrobiales bacterium]